MQFDLGYYPYVTVVKPINVVCLNVRILLDASLSKCPKQSYNTTTYEIVALSKTRRVGESNIRVYPDGYILYWKDKAESVKKETDVGLLRGLKSLHLV